jgi:hypothetical protein
LATWLRPSPLSRKSPARHGVSFSIRKSGADTLPYTSYNRGFKSGTFNGTNPADPPLEIAVDGGMTSVKAWATRSLLRFSLLGANINQQRSRNLGSDLSHEFMDWALPSHVEKFVPLSSAQGPGERELRTETIDTRALLTCIALHGNLYDLHRNILAFRVPKHSQRLARAQRRIVEVMGIGSRSLATLLDTEVGGKAISTDVDLMPHRRSLISHDSNCHDFRSPRRTSNKWYLQVHNNVYSEESRKSLHLIDLVEWPVPDRLLRDCFRCKYERTLFTWLTPYVHP